MCAKPFLRCAVSADSSHAVEDDDRVVHGVADDGEQRGEEDPVDGLAEPGEHAGEDQYVVCHRGDRGRAECPAEPHGEIEQLGAQGYGECDERAAAEFVAEARADQFVAELVRRPAEVFDGGGDFGLLCGGAGRCGR